MRLTSESYLGCLMAELIKVTNIYYFMPSMCILYHSLDNHISILPGTKDSLSDRSLGFHLVANLEEMKETS